MTIFCVTDAVQPFSLFAITDMIFDDVFISLSSYHSCGRAFRLSVFTNLISRANPASICSSSLRLIHRRVIDIYFPNFAALHRENRRKMKRGGDHLEREKRILLLTPVSQLNPLAGAINILVMMSDEPPCRRGRRSQENVLLWMLQG